MAVCLGLKSYLQSGGDGRSQPCIPAGALLWALLMGQLLRRSSFAGIEALVCSPARQALRVSRQFGDDTLGYFTERLDPAATIASRSGTPMISTLGIRSAGKRSASCFTGNTSPTAT